MNFKILFLLNVQHTVLNYWNWFIHDTKSHIGSYINKAIIMLHKKLINIETGTHTQINRKKKKRNHI